MNITGWQLALIILGSLWLGALAGFFLCACLTVASDADDAEYRYWLETESVRSNDFSRSSGGTP